MTDRWEAYSSFVALIRRIFDSPHIPDVPDFDEPAQIERLLGWQEPWEGWYLARKAYLVLACALSPDPHDREHGIAVARSWVEDAHLLGRVLLILAHLLRVIAGDDAGRDEVESLIAEGIPHSLEAQVRNILEDVGD